MLLTIIGVMSLWRRQRILRSHFSCWRRFPFFLVHGQDNRRVAFLSSETQGNTMQGRSICSFFPFFLCHSFPQSTQTQTQHTSSTHTHTHTHTHTSSTPTPTYIHNTCSPSHPHPPTARPNVIISVTKTFTVTTCPHPASAASASARHHSHSNGSAVYHHPSTF